MSLLQLKNLSIAYGMEKLLDNINLTIKKKERIGLLGRNGEGKSTLLNIIAEKIQADTGERIVQQSLNIQCLTQTIAKEMAGNTIYDTVISGLGEIGSLLASYHRLNHQAKQDKKWLDDLMVMQSKIEQLDGWTVSQKVNTVLSKMQLSSELNVSSLSGGYKRRVLLAKALVSEPDIILLDEPTNHLDIATIEWLENFLGNYSGTFILVTHDRQFLQKTCNHIIELNNGCLHHYDCDYQHYLQRREARLLQEEKAHHLFDKKLAQEETWIRQGIKARRTRNEGRVRALKALREKREERRYQQGNVHLTTPNAQNSGKQIVLVENVQFAYEGKKIIDNFSAIVLKGDKIGIVGPNGCGKTTLLKLLLGSLTPTCGEIKRGTELTIAYFDQHRQQLNENESVLDNVAEGAQEIIVNGKRKHVMSYLQDFLFSPKRARSPVSQLSGGERNRLLLAKLLTRPVNVLVMDEPSNDLDLETLELLEAMLVAYQGTVFLVSHDRVFLNNVVTSTWVFTSQGQIKECIGGYDEAMVALEKNTKIDSKKIKKSDDKKSTNKLSYNEKRELALLPRQIEQQEIAIKKMQEKMIDPHFYKQSENTLSEQQVSLQQKEAALAKALARWEYLEEKNA